MLPPAESWKRGVFTRGRGGSWRAVNMSVLFTVVAPVSQTE